MSILKKLAEELGVEEIHETVEKWFTEGSPTAGPLAFPQPEEFLDKLVDCTHFYKEAPAKPFPGLRLGFVNNSDIWVLVETGEVVSIHHDSLAEVTARAYRYDVPSPREFAGMMASEGSGFKMDEFLGLAREVSDWPSLWPLDMTAHERARTFAKGLGWSGDKLFTAFRGKYLPFEFLRLEENVLADLAAAEPKLEKMDARPSAKKIDLGGCRLGRWPDILDNSPVERLDLTGNPDLPWNSAELHQKLKALPKLKTLVAAKNHLGPAAELKAALPGVTVDTRPSYKIEDLLEMIRSPQEVTYLDLREAELIHLPAEVTKLAGLEVIDLSENPLLDWEDACNKLAQLKHLKEVKFEKCGLTALPPGFKKLKTLEHLDFGHVRGPAVEDQTDLFKALPRLKEINLGGRFPSFAVFNPDPDYDGFDMPVLEHVETIKLKVALCNYLPAIVRWLNKLPKFQTLHIDTASGDLAPLKELKPLKGLHISGYKLGALPDVLKTQPELESLSFIWHCLYHHDIHTDKIVPFPGEIRSLKKLKHLNTCWLPRWDSNKALGYKGGELPDWLSELPLETFEYDTSKRDGGGLKEIPTVLYELTGLKKLVLIMRGAEVELSPDIARLTALEEFEFETWGSEFPPGICFPKSLKKFKAEAVPENLGELDELRELVLGNRLDGDQADALAGLTKLETLKVFFKEGIHLPETLTKLKDLHCSGGIPQLPLLTKLKTSDKVEFPANLPKLRQLSWNPIGEHWPDDFQIIAQYPKLRILWISFDAWDKKKPKLSMFKGLEHLEELWIGNTDFRASFLKGLKKKLPYTRVLLP